MSRIKKLLAICIIAVTTQFAHAQLYTVQRIQSKNNAQASAYGVNDNNVVVGRWTNPSGDIRGFVWSQIPINGASFRNMTTLGGAQSVLYSVNNAGRAVGRAQDGGGIWRPIYVDITSNLGSSASLVQLGSGGTNAQQGGRIEDITEDNHRYVGSVTDSGGNVRARIWHTTGLVWTATNAGSELLGVTNVPYQGGSFWRAVGYRTNGTGNKVPFFIDAQTSGATVGSVTDISRGHYSDGVATAINGHGLIVGRVKGGGAWTTCYWDPFDGYATPHLLPTLGVGTANERDNTCHDVSSTGGSFIYGNIVGTVYNGGSRVACVWVNAGAGYQLQLLYNAYPGGYGGGSTYFYEAEGINNLTSYTPTVAGRGEVPGSTDAVIARSAESPNRGTGVAIGSVSFSADAGGSWQTGLNNLLPGQIILVRSHLEYKQQGQSIAPNPLMQDRSVFAGHNNPAHFSAIGNLTFPGTNDSLFDANGANVSNAAGFIITGEAWGQSATITAETTPIGFFPQSGTISVRKEATSINPLTAESSLRLLQPGAVQGRLVDNSNYGSYHGRPLPGRTITFRIADASGSNFVGLGGEVTGSNGYALKGIAPLPMSIGAGTRILASDYAGSAADDPSVSAISVTVLRAFTAWTGLNTISVPAGQTAPLMARLVHSDGSPVASASVTFSVFGNNYPGTTNATGDVLVNVSTTGRPSGTYPVQVQYAGDANREPVTAGFNLVLSNGAPTAGLYASALKLADNGGYVVLPAQRYIGQTSSYTLETWVKPRVVTGGTPGFARLFEAGVAAQSTYAQFLAGGENNTYPPFYQTTTNGTYGNNVASGSVLPANVWTHVAITHTGNVAKMYINGLYVAQGPVIYPPNIVATEAFFGKAILPFSTRMDVDMNDFRVWNYARSDAEIAGSRDRRLSGDEPGLLSLWRLNDGGGTHAVSSSGLDGTLMNGASFAASQVPVNRITVPGWLPSNIELGGYDPNGDALTYQIVTGPSSGTLQQVNGATWTYSPNATDLTTVDSFSYQVTDSNGLQSPPFTVFMDRESKVFTLHLNLQDWPAATDGIRVEVSIVAVPGEGEGSNTITSELNSEGDIVILGPQTGNYVVKAKASHWLRKSVGSMSFTVPNPTASATLVNGDVNEDNVVDLADYLALVASFDLISTDSGFDPNADLNGDGGIDLGDYLILAGAFDQTGD